MSLKKVEKKKIISSGLIKIYFFCSNLSIENIKIIGFLIIINLFTQISSDNSLSKIISEFSYITLKLSGIGQKKYLAMNILKIIQMKYILMEFAKLTLQMNIN